MMKNPVDPVNPVEMCSCPGFDSCRLHRDHRVKKGETLSSIASEFNTTIAELKRDNGKIAGSLKAGSVLLIKAAD
jgi:LysM repeat protein